MHCPQSAQDFFSPLSAHTAHTKKGNILPFWRGQYPLIKAPSQDAPSSVSGRSESSHYVPSHVCAVSSSMSRVRLGRQTTKSILSRPRWWTVSQFSHLPRWYCRAWSLTSLSSLCHCLVEVAACGCPCCPTISDVVVIIIFPARDDRSDDEGATVLVHQYECSTSQPARSHISAPYLTTPVPSGGFVLNVHNISPVAGPFWSLQVRVFASLSCFQQDTKRGPGRLPGPEKNAGAYSNSSVRIQTMTGNGAPNRPGRPLPIRPEHVAFWTIYP
jgi:hypothetical protein